MSEMNDDFNTLSSTTEVNLPSSRVIIIREQNGLDDAILSTIRDSKDGTNLCKFLAGIVTIDKSIDRKPVFEEIEDWHVSDKYYAMLASRVFSLDSELKFVHQCSECSLEHEYTEDLAGYFMDYICPEGKPDLLLKNRAKPYPNLMDKSRIITLSSKKQISYDYLTGKGEKTQLAIGLDNANRLDELKARNLSLKNEVGIFLPLNDMDFTQLTARDMREIRADIFQNDPQFYGMSEMKCPESGCGKVDVLPLAANMNFFYPQEI